MKGGSSLLCLLRKFSSGVAKDFGVFHHYDNVRRKNLMAQEV